MNEQDVRRELKRRGKADDRKSGYHMMATKAFHLRGNISSDKPDLCFIYNETPDFYIGSWVTGFGFFDVLFPKESTRALTDAEIKKYNSQKMAISDTGIADLEIKPNPTPVVYPH